MLEEVRQYVRGLDLVLEHVCESRFDDLSRVIRPRRRPLRKIDRVRCGTAAMPCSLTRFESVMSNIAFPRWLGNTSGLPLVIVGLRTVRENRRPLVLRLQYFLAHGLNSRMGRPRLGGLLKLLEVEWAGFLVGGSVMGEEGRGRRGVLRPSFEAPPGRVVNRGGRVGRKSLPPAGAAQVRGRSFDGAGGHRVDHQIVRAVLASRLARCRGQRPPPRALIVLAIRERHRGQIERWRTFTVRRGRNHRSRHCGHSRIHRFRLCVTVLQRLAVHRMRRAAVCHTASCRWPGSTIACAISGRSVSRMSSQGARST